MTEEKEMSEEETPKEEAPEEAAEAEAPPEEAEAEAPPEEAAEKAEPEEPKAEEPKKEQRYTRHQLQRLTTKKLREIAMELGEVTGVHGMKKDELVDAIFAVRGREVSEDAQEPSIDKSAIKSEIRDLKARRDSALTAGDALELKRVRKRIKRLKRALRKAS